MSLGESRSEIAGLFFEFKRKKAIAVKIERFLGKCAMLATVSGRGGNWECR